MTLESNITHFWNEKTTKIMKKTYNIGGRLGVRILKFIYTLFIL